jgi:hypothetical protein
MVRAVARQSISVGIPGFHVEAHGKNGSEWTGKTLVFLLHCAALDKIYQVCDIPN